MAMPNGTGNNQPVADGMPSAWLATFSRSIAVMILPMMNATHPSAMPSK